MGHTAASLRLRQPRGSDGRCPLHARETASHPPPQNTTFPRMSVSLPRVTTPSASPQGAQHAHPVLHPVQSPRRLRPLAVPHRATKRPSVVSSSGSTRSQLPPRKRRRHLERIVHQPGGILPRWSSPAGGVCPPPTLLHTPWRQHGAAASLGAWHVRYFMSAPGSPPRQQGRREPDSQPHDMAASPSVGPRSSCHLRLGHFAACSKRPPWRETRSNAGQPIERGERNG